MSAKAKPVKSKAPKDPDAPRKPLSAFFLFCGKERAVVQKELSSLNGAAVTRELGKRWALLDDKAKEVFEKASVEDKKRYEDGMKSYKPSEEFLKMKAAYEAKVKTPIAAVVTNPVDQMTKQNPVEEYFCHLLLNWREVHLANPGNSARQTQEEVWRVWQARSQAGTSKGSDNDVKKGGKRKAAKDPEAPKRPPTSYFLFCRAKRAEMSKASPNLKSTEVTVELSRLWGELGEDGKAPYVLEAAKLSKKFNVENEIYLKKKKDTGVDEGKGRVDMGEEEGADVEDQVGADLEAGRIEAVQE